MMKKRRAKTQDYAVFLQFIRIYGFVTLIFLINHYFLPLLYSVVHNFFKYILL